MADFQAMMLPYQMPPFRYWAQKILPAVYDDSLSYYELLNKIVQKLNEVIELANASGEQSSAAMQALIEIRDNLDKFVIEAIKSDPEMEERIMAQVTAYIESMIRGTTYKDLRIHGFIYSGGE